MKSRARGLLSVFLLLAMHFGVPGPLVVTAAESNAASPHDAIEGVEWTLTELKGKPSQAAEGRQRHPTLRLDQEKKQANGFSGVNRFFGSYERDGEKLKFGALAGTRMAGPPEAMALEKEYLGMLSSVTGVQEKDGTLNLLKDEEVVARFSAKKAAEK